MQHQPEPTEPGFDPPASDPQPDPDPTDTAETGRSDTDPRDVRDIPTRPDEALPNAWDGFLVPNTDDDEPIDSPEYRPNPNDPRPGDRFDFRLGRRDTGPAMPPHEPVTVVYVDPDVILLRSDQDRYMVMNPADFALRVVPPSLPPEFWLLLSWNPDHREWRTFGIELNEPEKHAAQQETMFAARVSLSELVDLYRAPEVLDSDISTELDHEHPEERAEREQLDAERLEDHRDD